MRISRHKVHGADFIPVKHVKTNLPDRLRGSIDLHENTIKKLKVLKLCAAEMKDWSNLNQSDIIRLKRKKKPYTLSVFQTSQFGTKHE